jgi:hypothetical protein
MADLEHRARPAAIVAAATKLANRCARLRIRSHAPLEPLMPYTVIVSFGKDMEYEFKVPDNEVTALPRDEAGEWLNQQFDAFDCAPRNPVGKILLLDVIIDVAKYGGDTRFRENGEWANRFALCCAATLKRDILRVDTVDMVVR